MKKTGFILGGCGIIACLVVIVELNTHYLQSLIFHSLAKNLSFSVIGGYPETQYPQHGPENTRRGYSRLSEFSNRLQNRNHQIHSGTRLSRSHQSWVDKGLYAIYHPKTAAGLTITDGQGTTFYHKQFPGYFYPTFDSVPLIMVKSLLFIENRGLLDSSNLRLNPSIAWKRMANSGFEFIKKSLGSSVNVSGASTLSTQIEKYKFSPDGLTGSASEKIRQIISASTRAYQEGRNTLPYRKQIAVDYINTVPLSAISGFGEIYGINEGLKAWYGADIESLNKALKLMEMKGETEVTEKEWSEIGNALRMVLNLFVAQRRPTYYLRNHPEVLEGLVVSYLGRMQSAGIISEKTRQAAAGARPVINKQVRLDIPFNPSTKAAYSYRANISRTLGLASLYELDRLDLEVQSTLNLNAQEYVINYFKQLSDPAFVSGQGLKGPRMLDRGKLDDVVYSLIVYENLHHKNLVRIYADNYPKPMNINEGAKLDLGSTAKMRTLVHYLHILAEIYQSRKSGLPDPAVTPFTDPLSTWMAEYLKKFPQANLPEILEAGLARKYSANPGERFFTGGGRHQFNNFDNTDNHKHMTVTEALVRSNNLVFIRIMRDILKYTMERNPNRVLMNAPAERDSVRKNYLEKFATFEGRVFLRKYFQKYKGKNDSAIESEVLHSLRLTPKKTVYLFHFLYPDSGISGYRNFIMRHGLFSEIQSHMLEKIFSSNNKDFILSDVAWLLKTHPLNVWCARQLLLKQPSDWKSIREAAGPAILEVYQWLMKPKKKKAQDNRIWTMLEMEAFTEIHSFWKNLGYPFSYLTPSLATSIGSSGDRPASLAKLMGILVGAGKQQNHYGISHWAFAGGTPYETHFTPAPREASQVLRAEVARAALESLNQVVTGGTAIRLKNAYRDSSGKALTVGGKTGTGDHVQKTYGKSGALKSKKVIGRTATFVFHIDKKLFGVITASVQGEKAARYGFTSTLPVQILKNLEPGLRPLVN